RKTAWLIGPNVPVVIASLSIELVGDERERDIIGAIESPHDFEDRASESGVAGRIRWERWREVRAIEIARRRTQRATVSIANRTWVAVARPMVRSWIRSANTGDRSPEVVIVF